MATLIPKYDIKNGGATPTGAINRPINQKLSEWISVKDFGAVGDFNPSTGVGTDDRASIQAAINYAQSLPSGGIVYFPSGRYYLGQNWEIAPNVATQLIIGSRTVANAANNVCLYGESAEIYQGTTGRVLIISNAHNTTISGLSFYGYMGGTMTLTRATGHYSISIELNSYNTRIENNYITNFPAWAIHVDGDLLDPAAALYVPREVNIYNNTIKQRYGDGVSAALGGTASLWCIAAIQADGLFIENNTLIGNVDIETNSSQLMNNININNNQFISGWVTPIPTPASSVSTYWADEVTNPVGTGSQINQAVAYNGSTTVNGDICNIVGNTFEKGTIYFYGNQTSGFRANVNSNYFKVGSMLVGWSQGGASQVTNFSSIANNLCDKITTTSSAFITLIGQPQFINISNNIVLQDAKQIIAFDAIYGGDTGCTYYNNRSMGGQFVGLAAGAVKTITITLSASAPFNISIDVSANAFGAAGSAYAKLAVGGIMGASTLYYVTSLAGTNNGITISAVTKNNTNLTFTVTNTTGQAGYLNLDISGTSIPKIEIA
jgi:hypothetical protein